MKVKDTTILITNADVEKLDIKKYIDEYIDEKFEEIKEELLLRVAIMIMKTINPLF